MPVPRLKMMPDGLEFSRLSFGFMRLLDWQLSPAEVLDLLHALLHLGVTTLDHADIYGGYRCEEALATRWRWNLPCGTGLRLSPNAGSNCYRGPAIRCPTMIRAGRTLRFP